jgi:hypothetical protein
VYITNLKGEKKMGMPKGKLLIDVNDIIGKRLGKLKIIDYAGRGRDKTAGGERVRHWYLCKCACGERCIIRRSALKNESVHSCGCIKRKRR